MRIPTSSFGALLPAPSSRWPAVILAGLFCGAMAEAYLIPEPPSSNDAAVQVPVIQGTTEVQQVRYAQSSSGALVGYSAPIRMARVASAEAGVVRALVVTEGSSVRAGQTLAQLDDREWIASRDVAVAARDAHGELDEARAELELRTGRLAALERLGLAGHSNPEELRRAESDHRLANSRYERRRFGIANSNERRKSLVSTSNWRHAKSPPFAGIISEVLKQLRLSTCWADRSRRDDTG
ncbi:MAG: biotin/lipoyl-binding protein [Pirellulaceae bacterium]